MVAAVDDLLAGDETLLLIADPQGRVQVIDLGLQIVVVQRQRSVELMRLGGLLLDLNQLL